MKGQGSRGSLSLQSLTEGGGWKGAADDACCSGVWKLWKEGTDIVISFFPPCLYFPIFVDEESEAWGGAAICPKAGTYFFLKKRRNRVFTEHLLSTRHGSELGDQASSLSPASLELTPASQGQSPGMGGLRWGLSFLLSPYPGRRSRFIPRFLSPQALPRPKGKMMRSQ